MTLKSIGIAFLWLIPYLVGGFSAPFIFKNSSNFQTAGHIAGALFIFAGVWSIFLAFKFQMSPVLKIYFVFVLALQILFWTWRFFNNLPLKEASLLTFPGSSWHGLLTSFYLLVALLLFINIGRSSAVKTVTVYT